MVALNNKKILAIIPARAGSKRLPGKNSKILCGKPLVQWTIEAALQCPLITDVLVSTDSQEIFDIAKQSGAQVPFLRPPEIANDTATAIDVVKHTLGYLAQQQKVYDYIVWLQPTSPLRSTKNIIEAINKLEEKSALGVISVCECDHSPLWSNTLDDSERMEHFLTDFLKSNPRSQSLPAYYRLNGAIYIAQVDELVRQGTFFLEDKLYAYVMDSEASVDIDHRLDFKLAELLLTEAL